MTRIAMLRAGYAGVGLAFAAMAATLAVPTLILAGLGIAFLAGVLLAFSDDHLPKWAGLALVSYFLLSALGFILTSGATVKVNGENFFFAPPDLFGDVIYWVGLVSPIMLAGAALAAVWEREPAPRSLLIGALCGMVLFAILSVVLVPDGSDLSDAAQRGQSQAQLLQVLFALSAAVGATGALWAASRPDEF